MINRLIIIGIVTIALGGAACNHAKPKPISGDVTKTTVTVAGKKDSVINNPEKNYGNATVSEPCVKCLLQVIQQANSYKKLTLGIAQQHVIYDVNWITSSKPIKLDDGSQIVNGMQIAVNEKNNNSTKRITTYLYNNENAAIYLQNAQNKIASDVNVSDTSLKKIRNSCFWGVASAK